jgi:micrococcal nuclease
MKTKKKKKEKVPFGRAVIMSVLAFVSALGGYGGYRVVKDYGDYGVDFEKRVHIVESIVDGDTILVENGVRVRLLGVNAPEKNECYGDESKKELSRLIMGREIILEKDQTAKDGFGRLLRYIFIHNDSPIEDNLFVNKKMVRGGFARAQYVKPNKKYLAFLQAAEREAKNENLGLWKNCDYKSAQAGREKEREQMTKAPSKDCVIKGNISKSYTKDYFVPKCPNYKRVIVDERKGEKWFCSEKEAKKAGWKKSASCGNLR